MGGAAGDDRSRPRGRRRVVLALGAGAGFALTGAFAQGLRQLVGATSAPIASDGRPALRGRAPAIFVGHGSPMNALQDNRFTRTLQRWGHELGLPRAVVVVSAHWLTPRSTRVSTASEPETIHDFGGFPAELQAMRYPAPGAPALAAATAARLGPRAIGSDAQRGLDHGAWTVLHRLYPAADVPVFQVSIDIAQPGAYHLAVGRALAALRDDGVLVLGSGNIVHNLGATERGAGESAHGATAWAEDFDQQAKRALDAGDRGALAAYQQLSPAAPLAVPSPDHYYPMLYALGAARPDEAVRHVFEGFQAGTLSMRCLQWG
ncbi:MAG TPA: 4,5-DOPA dioxygenase extradiol [Caldimonas sp.]|nr:4,5-DOPA dioxygenase extradiol [Caldimonas sp.]